jgi:hypothetical protein
MPCRKSVHLQVDLLTPIVSCMNPVSLHMGHNVPVIPWCWLLEHLPQSSAHSSPLSSSETSLAEAQRIILCALASYLAAHADGLSPPFCEYQANGSCHYHFDSYPSRVYLPSVPDLVLVQRSSHSTSALWWVLKPIHLTNSLYGTQVLPGHPPHGVY